MVDGYPLVHMTVHTTICNRTIVSYTWKRTSHVFVFCPLQNKSPLVKKCNKKTYITSQFIWSWFTGSKNSKWACLQKCWTFSFLFPRRGCVTLPLLHHAKLPAQDAGAALHPEARRENPFTGGPARHHTHPCCWGCQVHHHLPCVLTGWDRRQCWPAGKRDFMSLNVWGYAILSNQMIVDVKLFRAWTLKCCILNIHLIIICGSCLQDPLTIFPIDIFTSTYLQNLKRCGPIPAMPVM